MYYHRYGTATTIALVDNNAFYGGVVTELKLAFRFSCKTALLPLKLKA